MQLRAISRLQLTSNRKIDVVSSLVRNKCGKTLQCHSQSFLKDL